MTHQNLVHIYPNLEAAEAAVKCLTESNFPINQISIITQNIETTQHHGFITAGDVAAAAKGLAPGAWIGGFLGLLVGATFIWVPGFAPLFIAGPFALSLLGGLEGMAAGAAAGGLLSAWLGLDASKENLLSDEAGLKSGEYLLVANGDDAQLSQVQTILGNVTNHWKYPVDREKVLKFLS